MEAKKIEFHVTMPTDDDERMTVMLSGDGVCLKDGPEIVAGIIQVIAMTVASKLKEPVEDVRNSLVSTAQACLEGQKTKVVFNNQTDPLQ